MISSINNSRIRATTSDVGEKHFSSIEFNLPHYVTLLMVASLSCQAALPSLLNMLMHDQASASQTCLTITLVSSVEALLTYFHMTKLTCRFAHRRKEKARNASAIYCWEHQCLHLCMKQKRGLRR
jgi:hypothetical protein